MNQKDIKKVFQGEIFSIWQWEQELYDGTTKTFERATRRDAAGIIGVLPDKKIILTWDEQPDRAGVLTPAGGGLEEGENAEQGALREFQEETGYTTSEIIPLLSYRPFFFRWKKLYKKWRATSRCWRKNRTSLLHIRGISRSRTG
jgi:8-oxo-dGTP pyrophosphatase MutT (NUDIX family)